MGQHGNVLFVFFAALSGGGMFLIPSEQTELAVGFQLGLVALYGFVSHGAISRISDGQTVHHRIESVYFLGFFMTLMAMVTLFLDLSSRGIEDLADGGLPKVFLYIGISVVTTMAGVLGRNILNGLHLKRLQDPEQGLEEHYLLLQEIAEGFNHHYNETFQSIGEFLDERKENSTIFAKKEREFLDALSQLSSSLKKVGDDIRQSDDQLRTTADQLRKTLTDQVQTTTAMARASEDLAQYISYTREQLEDLPFQTINGNFKDFAYQTDELKAVLDSAIDVLENKLARV